MDLLLAVSQLHAHFAGLVQKGLAADGVDLVLLEQVVHARSTLVGDGAGALDELGPVVGDVLDREGGTFRVRHTVVELRIVQQRLGWDAAPVVAGAAATLLLHTSDFFAQLGSADGCDIARRPPPMTMRS